MQQKMLPLMSAPRHYRPVLVDLNCAATAMETDPERMIEGVDCGVFGRVWDLAAKGSPRRELRFHLAELFKLSAGIKMDPETPLDLVNRIVGKESEPMIHSMTVAALLQVRRPTVIDWLKSGELEGPPVAHHRQMIARDSLVNFLVRRFVG